MKISHCSLYCINFIYYCVLCSEDRKLFKLNSCCPFQNSFQKEFQNCTLGNNTEYYNQNSSSLISKFLQNPTPQLQLNITFTINNEDILDCGSSSFERIEIQAPTNVTEHLSTYVQNEVLHHRFEYYHRSGFCIDRVDEQSLVLFICKPHCRSSELCFPKCCEYGKVLIGSKCVPANDDLEWAPTLHKNVRTVSNQSSRNIHWRYANPRTLCEHGKFYFHERVGVTGKSLFRILEDGRVIEKVKSHSHWVQIPEDEYCIEGYYHESSRTFSDFVFRCTEKEGDGGIELYPAYRIGIVSGCFTSAFFVFVTILVYVLLWESQNIHGWTLVCSFTSLFSLYMHLGFMHGYHLSWGIELEERNLPCWIIAVGLHFSYLSFFSWTTIVNFDLWYSFRNLRVVNQNQKRLRRFLKYCIFGFGIPLSILSVSLYFDRLYAADELADYVFPNPDYGREVCFLARNESPIAYFLAPVGILLLINILFIVVTITSVHQAQKIASIAVNNSSHRHKQSLKLFGKLLIVMGIFWVFEIISQAVSRSSVPWYFAIFDLINVCHGFFIFLVFVCKKSTISSLKQKYTLIARFVGAVSDWQLSAKNCILFIPNKIRQICSNDGIIVQMRLSGRRKRSNQSERTTEMSTAV